ncbi:hypothetical protein EV714DRAFT_235839 [Schizophyllum commune]
MSFALVLKIYETWISHGLPGVLPQATAMTALTASAMQLGPRLLKAAPEVLDTVPALYKKFTNVGLAQGPQRDNDSEQSINDDSSDVPALYADGDAGGPLSLLSDDAEALTAPPLVFQQTTPSLRAEPVQATTLPFMINADASSNSSHLHEAFTNATCSNNTLQFNITIDAQHAAGHASTVTATSDSPSQWLPFAAGCLQPTILVSVCAVIVSIAIFFKLLSPRSITSMWARLSSHFKPEVILTPSNTAEMLALQERYPSVNVSSPRDIERRQTYQVKMHKYEMNKAKAERAEPDAAARELDEAGAEPGARADEDVEAAAPEGLVAGQQPSTFVVPVHAADREPAAHAEGPLLDSRMQMDDAVDFGVDPLARTVDVRPPQDSESDLFVVASASTEVDTVVCPTDVPACDDSLPFPPTASMDTIDLPDEPPRRWTRAEKEKWRADITPQDVAQPSPPRAIASLDAVEKADEDTRGPPARRAQVHRSAHHARALASIVPIVRRHGQQARRLRARRARATRAWSAVARLAYYPGAEDLDLELPAAPPPSPDVGAGDFAVAGVVDLVVAGAVDVAGNAAFGKDPLVSPSASMDTIGMPDTSPRRYTRAEKGKQRAYSIPVFVAASDVRAGSPSFAKSMCEAEERLVDTLHADAHLYADVAQALAMQAVQVDHLVDDVASSSSAHSSLSEPFPPSSSCPAVLPSMLPMFLSHVAARRSQASQASGSSSVTQTSMRLQSEGETSGKGLVYFPVEELEAFFARLHTDLDRLQTEMEEKDSMRFGDEDTDEEGRDDVLFEEGRDEEDGGRTDDAHEDEQSYFEDSDEDRQDYSGGSDEDEQAHSENSDDEQGYLEDSDEDVEDVDGRAQAEVDVRAEAATGRYADVDVQREDDTGAQTEDASLQREDADVRHECMDVQRDDAHVHHGDAGVQAEAVQQLNKVPVQEQDIDTHHAEDASVDGQDKDVDVQQADVEDRRVDRENLRADVDGQPADVADQHVDAEKQRPDDGIQRNPPSPHHAHGLAREVNDKQVPGNDDNDERVPDTITPEAVVATGVGPKLEAAADDEADMAAAKVHAPLDAKDHLPVEPVNADDQRSVAPVNEEGRHPVEHVDAQDRRPVEHVDAQEQHPVAPIADLRVPVEAGIDVAVQQAPHMPHLAGDLAQENDDEQAPADDVDDDDGDDDGEEVSDDDEQVPDVDEEQVPEDEEEQIPDHEHEQAPGGTGPIAGAEPDARAEVRAPVEPAVAEEQLPVEPVAAEPLPVAPVNMKDERPVEPIIPEEQLAAERADADLRAPVEVDAAAAMQQENEVRVNGLADGEARADLDGPADDGVAADHARLEGEDTDEEEDDAVLPDVEAREAPVDGAEEAAGDRDEDAGPALAVPEAAAEAEHRVGDVDVRVEARLVQRMNTRTEGPKIAYAVGEYEKTGAPATTWIPFPGVALPRTPLPSPRLPKVGADFETIDRAETDEGGLLGFPDPATVLAHKLDRTNMSDIAIARGQDVAHQAAVRAVSARDLPRVLAQLLYTILMSEDILSSIISPHLRSAPPPENAEDAVEGTKASKSNHLFLLLGLAYIQDRDDAARIAREIFEPAVKLAEALYSAEKPDPETLAADIEVQRHNALSDKSPQKPQPLGDDGSIPEYRIYAARWSLSKAPASSDCGTSSCAPLAPALDALNSADSADAPTATELPDAAKSSGEPLSKPDGSGLSAASSYLKRKKSGTGDEQDEQDEEEVFARLKRTREYTNEED